MTIYPPENNDPSLQMVFPPVMDSLVPMGPGSGPLISPNFGPVAMYGNLLKSITNVKVIQKDGTLVGPNPLPVYTIASGPSGKLHVFVKRSSGTVNGTVSLYGAFKENAAESDHMAIIEGISWSDNLAEIVADFVNPFSVILVRCDFESTEDVAIELNFSSY